MAASSSGQTAHGGGLGGSSPRISTPPISGRMAHRISASRSSSADDGGERGYAGFGERRCSASTRPGEFDPRGSYRRPGRPRDAGCRPRGTRAVGDESVPAVSSRREVGLRIDPAPVGADLRPAPRPATGGACNNGVPLACRRGRSGTPCRAAGVLSISRRADHRRRSAAAGPSQKCRVSASRSRPSSSGYGAGLFDDAKTPTRSLSSSYRVAASTSGACRRRRATVVRPSTRVPQIPYLGEQARLVGQFGAQRRDHPFSWGFWRRTGRRSNVLARPTWLGPRWRRLARHRAGRRCCRRPHCALWSGTLVRAALPGSFGFDHPHALTGHRRVPVGVDGAGANSRNVSRVGLGRQRQLAEQVVDQAHLGQPDPDHGGQVVRASTLPGRSVTMCPCSRSLATSRRTGRTAATTCR